MDIFEYVMDICENMKMDFPLQKLEKYFLKLSKPFKKLYKNYCL